jgi:formylmethanofuran dehydrogenase subunit D
MIFQLVMKLLTDKASLSALRYWKSVTICEIDPEDMRYLGVKENQNVKIATDCVRAVKSLRAPRHGAVFVPYGPWASIVVNPKTHGTGMPSFEGIETISAQERNIRCE